MEKRNFVTSVLADNMLAKARVKDGCVLEMSTVKPEDLRDIELISALRSKAISGTLYEKYGVDVRVNPVKIQVLPGDTIYVLNVVGVANVNSYETEDILPEQATIEVAKYEVFSKKEFIKKILSSKNVI